MKRTPLKRKTYLRRVNRQRRKKLYEIQFGDYAQIIRGMGCCLEHCRFVPADPAHVKSRGAGGTKTDLVPLCHEHHRQQHQWGILKFQHVYKIDLAEIAAQLWEKYGEH